MYIGFVMGFVFLVLVRVCHKGGWSPARIADLISAAIWGGLGAGLGYVFTLGL